MKKEFKLGYYSHSIRKYNTRTEKSEYDFLKSIFYGHIVCPNKHIGNIKNTEPYKNMIEKADVVFVSEFEDCIGRGVFEECQLALKLRKPTYIIRVINEQYCFFKLSKIKKITLNCTSNKYGKLIAKKYSPKQLFT